MQKCKTPDCDYYTRYGRCTEICKRNEVKRNFTNADQIRSMSDEELAIVVSKHRLATCDFTYVCMKKDCVKCTLRWLKREVTE